MRIIIKIKFKIFLFIANVIPSFHFFELRRYLLNIAGLKTGKGSRIAGKIYTTQPNIRIGENTWIGLNFTVYTNVDAKVIIGNCCDIAPNVIIYTGSHIIGDKLRRAGRGYSKDVIIGNGVWIGLRVTILAGVKISSGAIIAAGALVNKNIDKDILVAGIPAKIIRKLN